VYYFISGGEQIQNASYRFLTKIVPFLLSPLPEPNILKNPRLKIVRTNKLQSSSSEITKQ